MSARQWRSDHTQYLLSTQVTQRVAAAEVFTAFELKLGSSHCDMIRSQQTADACTLLSPERLLHADKLCKIEPGLLTLQGTRVDCPRGLQERKLDLSDIAK